MTNYPRLNQFFGAYLHQDLDLDHGDEWGALRAMLTAAPESAMAVRHEVAALLREHGSEAALAKVILTDMGACFDPTQLGFTWRDWLTRVSDEAGRLAAHPGAA